MQNTTKNYFSLLLLLVSLAINAQIETKSTDDLYKEKIYENCKKKIINYSLKDFDALFFEFFTKQNSASLTLTKEEYYNYTVQIAAFSDRLAFLYPNRKAEAVENKKVWMSKNYPDYLKTKASKK